MDMNTLLHYGGMIVTFLFVAAVLYSMIMAIRRRSRKQKAKEAVEKRTHIKVKNLHQFDIKPDDGYYKYPIGPVEYTRRKPQRFTAVSVELASQQPYSICLIGFAEFAGGELKDQHYFYIQPPEKDLRELKNPDVTWDLLNKADEFGEYWNAGMKDYFINHTLVCHNAPYVIGCITHALTVFGIKPPEFRFIDTLEIAKKLYTFDSNKLDAICDEMNIDLDMHNSLSEARAIGQFFYKSCKEFPMYLPRIYYANGKPSKEEQQASVIAVVEREEARPEDMFAPRPVDDDMLKELLDKKYLEPGKEEGTYYATDEGLDFSESLP